MSNAVYPVLQGLAMNVSRTPVWNTNIQQTVSGRELRGSYQLYPLYEFDLSYEFVRDGAQGTEFAQLTAFYLARQGAWDNFLFTDPSDNAVTTMAFGTGDGSTRAFQLTRSFGAGGSAFVEPVQNVNGTPSIYVNGTLKTAGTDYTISSTGLVTFTVAPAAAAALTWTGNFYYRCRFLDDRLQFTRIYVGFWEIRKATLRGSPANYV